MAHHSRLLAGDPGDRRLSADEVRATVFPSAGFSRGFNAEQVARFMSRVAWELDTLAEERTALEDEIRALNLEQQTRPAPVNGEPPGLPVPEQQAVYVLQRAQQNADSLMANAQQQARNMMEDGREQRERMLADGHSQRQRAIARGIEEAGREAARIAAQAPIDAQRMLAQYQALAEAVRAGMSANLRTLMAQVQSWEEQEHRSMTLPNRAPSGPQPMPQL